MEFPPNVVSISYGAPEELYTKEYLSQFNTLAMKLGVRGTTLIAASGDDGAAVTLYF